jgi:type II secretory pathway component PulK
MLLHHPSAGSSRRGVVLLAVLVVVVLLSLAAYKYNDHMLSEHRAADSAVRAAQARAYAESGVHYTAAMLLDVTGTLNSNPWNNPTKFQGVAVPGSSNNASGKVTILTLLAPDDLAQAGSSQPYRFGVTDESGKINLNALLALDNGQGNVATTLLTGLNLPGMTPDIIASILDWLDPDDTARTNGAESDYYGTLNPPYQCKNGPLDSLEELLLVKGVTPELLFGNDRNRNGVLDPDEDDGSGQVNLGWSAYFTVYSREPNVDSSNNGRIYINDKDINTLSQNLTTAFANASGGTDLVNYIIAYRMYGGQSLGGGKGGPGGGGAGAPRALGAGDRGAVTGALKGARATPAGKQKLQNIQSLWDLVNSTVSVPTGSGRTQRNISYPSPLNDPGTQQLLLPVLFDSCTTSQKSDLTPRINVNTAPQTVLTALTQVVTDLQDADVQTIITTRPSPTDTTAPDPTFASPAWLLLRANISSATLKKLEPYITTRTQVYRFQTVGFLDRGGPVSRMEAVVDTNMGRPRIVYLREITEVGRGFDMAALGGAGNN